MQQFNFLSGITKKIIIITTSLLLYGYLCRLAGLYFFWESKTIGWTLFWLSIIFIFRDRIRQKKEQHQKTIFEKIGIGVAVFVMLTKAVFFFAIPQTTLYENAVHFIKSNPAVINKTGPVKSIFTVPYGGFSMTTSSQGTAGSADVHFVVKGVDTFIDIHLLMNKNFDTEWQIVIADD
ncbi:MAG: hypothetical protein JST86_12220 [Bacteroidetes bacterium]|nr:hypothetical protein [Bacteroidota bacterium]